MLRLVEFGAHPCNRAQTFYPGGGASPREVRSIPLTRLALPLWPVRTSVSNHTS
jgi:hypothetical protein